MWAELRDRPEHRTTWDHRVVPGCIRVRLVSARHRGPMEVTKIRLPAERVAELDRLGQTMDRTRSYLIRKAVEEYLARHDTEPATEAR